MGLFSEVKFHNGAIKNEFQMWYYRLISKNGEAQVGILLGALQGRESKAFIQVMGAKFEDNAYFEYPVQDLLCLKDSLQLEDNYFSDKELTLKIEQGDKCIMGQVTFGELLPLAHPRWKRKLMGPFRYVPFFSSYHEIISMSHALEGCLSINGKEFDFNEGNGYLERDWGKSFPKVWVWSQCNHFKAHEVSLVVSIARLQLLVNYYTAFAVALWIEGKYRIYANYTGAHIAKLYRYKGYVHLIVIEKEEILEIKMFGDDDKPLVTPKSGHLIRDVYECLETKIEVKLVRRGRVIFEDVGLLGDMEIGGNTSKFN